MGNIKNSIPNTFTCLNLLFGCLAIVAVFKDNAVWAAYFVGIAAVWDFLDGFLARALNAFSPIGKELDSLADMVTFGVVPGVMMFKLIGISFIYQGLQQNISLDARELFSKLPYLAFLITIFSALRLAKFNIDTTQTKSFKGLPTPASAILIASISLVVAQLIEKESSPDDAFMTFIQTTLFNPYFQLSLTFLISFLLVSNLPLFSLKFANLGWQDNKIRYIFLALSLGLFIVFKSVGIVFIVFLYIILSIINNKLKLTE